MASPDHICQTRLDNGLRVISEHMPSAASVAVGFWVDAGSRDETPDVAGSSHFLEHLLFKGTATRNAQEIAETIEAVGGEMNAFTTKEYTAYYVRVLDENLDLGIEILSDIIWRPSLDPDEVEQERQVILEEILMHEDEPADLVHDLWQAAAFPGHPLGREIMGDRDTITALSREHISWYLDERYRPESIIVAAAGHVDHDALVAAVESGFSGRSGAAPARPDQPLEAPSSLTVLRRDTEQAHVVVGMRAIPNDDDDRFALNVVNQLMGGGMSSRLFQEVREKRGLVYSVFSYRAAYRETGLWAVYAGTAPGRADTVLDVIDTELARLLDEQIPDHELDVARGHLKGSLVLGLEDPGSRMGRLGRSLLVHGEVLPLREVAERTAAVTQADCRRVIERVLSGPRTLAVVGPFDEDAFAGRVA